MINKKEEYEELYFDDCKIISKQIMKVIMDNRKVCGEPCKNVFYCSECSDKLLNKIFSIVEREQPIDFIVPAYPFPMPNPKKTFGIVQPDRAELLSMQYLQRFCQNIRDFYSPGARIVIAADGDVLRPVWDYWFSIPEDVPQKYLEGLQKMIDQIGAQDVIKIWSLRDAYDEEDADQCRQKMLEDYPVSYEETCIQIKKVNTVQNLAYIGQKMYFANDGKDSPVSANLSVNKRKKISGELACRATHLAEAWSHKIAKEYPDAVRVSVHPYPAHFGEKIGIYLTDTKEEWMTPWHGVAVYYTLTGKWEIMKNYKAKEIGARLVSHHDGQPDYYIIDTLPVHVGKH